jgi:hypothetical protein
MHCNLQLGEAAGTHQSTVSACLGSGGRIHETVYIYPQAPLLDFHSTISPLKHIIRMASTAARSEVVPQKDLESFQAHLNKSKRILALLGAGLSASSGLPTFRGAGGIWRTHDATALATPEAFAANPGLVWQFYSYRRHMALQAKPNPAHYALAELAKKKGDDFVTLSQNVDGMYISRIYKWLE